MGLRQKLNDNPALSVAITAVIILATLAFVVRSIWFGAEGGAIVTGVEGTAFFTIDDGQNWFVGDARQLPPFERDGKPTVRAKVFECPDGKEFVGYLERYSPADKKKLEDAMKDSSGAFTASMLYASTVEVKKPGGKEWLKNTPKNRKQYQEVMSPTCPGDAGAGTPRPVVP